MKYLIQTGYCNFSRILFLIIVFVLGLHSGKLNAQLKAEMIFDLQTHHVHSSSLVELPNGDILTVWFEIMDSGRERTSKNVKLMGSRLRHGADTWSEVFLMAETPHLPDGNPVLFLNSKNKLFLVWHVLQAEVWNAAVLKVRTSIDYMGDNAPVWEWQDNLFLNPDNHFAAEVAAKLPAASGVLSDADITKKKSILDYDAHILSVSQDPILRSVGWMTRLQPIILQHGSHKGRILLPLSNESQQMSMCAISDDDGTTWTPGLPIVGRGNIQPALLEKRNGEIVAYMRDIGIVENNIQISRSIDGGDSWSPAQYIDINNPNSSIEVKALTDGRWVMVCNDMQNLKDTGKGCCDGRQRLALYVSEDEGGHWSQKLILEDDTSKPDEMEQRGRYHYPSIIQTRDGFLHLTYTFNIRETPYSGGKNNAIKYVVIDPADI